MSKTAIVFTANTLHVAQANLMIDSLYSETGGRFEGDLWVISTHLSKRCQRFLDSRGVRYLINPLTQVQAWPYRREIARAQPEFKNGSLSEDEAFLLYRNKRMSKLIVADWVDKFGADYDAIALCDNDLYFQQDVNALFERTAGVDPNVMWYWQEENENLPGTNLWVKNFHYTRLHDTHGLDFGTREINIGFVISSPRLMRRIFLRVKDLFWSCKIDLFRDFRWHDQDLVRVIRAQDPDLFRLFDEGDVLHLCNGGQTLVEEPQPQMFVHKKTGEMPTVVHFAGGAWKPFASIAASYKVKDDAYFFMEENTERFDEVRRQTDYDPFDAPTRFFTQHNLKTRNAARARWRSLKADSEKQSMLLFSWLDTGSHNPLRETLKDVLQQDVFDLAIIDGNVGVKDFGDLFAEDLPDLLSRVTGTVKNDAFGRSFGYVRSDVPEEAISGAIAALIKEYKCSERTARAVANAAYLYLSKALAFYRPDVVVCWGTYLLCPRILKHICRARGIPCITSELGVLPNTLAFDCLGHMGESWVAQDPEGFRALPLRKTDLTKARSYLKEVRASRPSRNIRLNTAPEAQALMAQLQASRKKVVVYVGSNCAFSGHVPYDEAGQRFHSPFYRDNDDVVRHLSELYADDPNVTVIYKPHPITITRGLDLEDDYPGITVLRDVNLDECIEIADLVIAKVSQGGYEALLRDRPVLMVGRNQINGSGAVYELSARDQLADAISEGLSNGLTGIQKKAFEDHAARLLRYYLYGVNGTQTPQGADQVVPTMAALLAGKGPEHLAAEQAALDAYRKPAPAKKTRASRPKLSIIMPVYNGEDYLIDCIGSILSQSFTDFELICVNNGSTDGSQEILDYFAGRDSRVRPLYQDEPNQRTARNYGVREARGTYLQFFDCDDLFVPDGHREIIETLDETKADALYFFFDELYNRQKLGEPRHRSFQPYLPKEPLFRMEQRHKHFFAQYPFPWAKVFRASFLREKGLYFDAECANFDDNPQNLRTLLSSDNIYVLNKPFYKFRINDNSMTQSVNPRVYGMISAVDLMNKIYDQFGQYESFQRSFVPYKVHLVHFAWLKLPENLRASYYAEIPGLFRPGDEAFFERDDLFSMFSYLTPEKVTFVRRALEGKPALLPEPAPAKKPKATASAVPVMEDMEFEGPIYASRIEAVWVPRISEYLVDNHPKAFRLSKKLYRSLRPLPAPRV